MRCLHGCRPLSNPAALYNLLGPDAIRPGGCFMILTLSAIAFGLFGLVLASGGAWLAILGGSWFYLLAGLVFLVTAYLLIRRREAAIWVYAAFILASLAWAIWEAGLDWWQLGPRGGLIVLFGLWLWTPVIRNRLTAHTGRPAAQAPIAAASIIAIAVAVFAMFQTPHDLEGELE